MNLERVVISEGLAVIRPDGRLNMASAASLRAAVSAAVDEGHARIVVDLSTTAFVDSSGLGALIGSLKATRQAGGNLRIAGPTEQVLTVLRLTNLDRVLHPFSTVDEATGDW